MSDPGVPSRVVQASTDVLLSDLLVWVLGPTLTRAMVSFTCTVHPGIFGVTSGLYLSSGQPRLYSSTTKIL